MTTITINARVEVVLTAHGADVLNAHKRERCLQPELVREGYVLRDELWCIMRVFGPVARFGATPYFVDNQIKVVAE